MNLEQLKEHLRTLKEQAAAKRALIKDDTPEADAQRIESEHAAILADVKKTETAIAAAEAGARAALPVQSAPAVDPAAIQAAAVEALRADRTRASDIRALGDRLGLRDLAAEHADKGTTFDAFKVIALDKLAAASDVRGSVGQVGVQIEVIRDETQTRRLAMADAIVVRLEQSTAKPGQKVTVPEQARTYAGMGFVELAAEVIGYRGHLRTFAQVNDVVTRAFHTTSDFPAIFLDAMNKRLLGRYQVATPTYRRFCALDTTTDFRAKNVVRPGDFPQLQPVTEAGEIKSGTFSESKELFQVSPYGVRFNISRQMIVNDDLRAIDQLLSSYGDAVTIWENVQVFNLLNKNSGNGPALVTDNVNVFNSAHGNLAGSGAAISVTSVGVARAAMMKQKSLDGLLLNLTPSVILTGPDKLTEAEQLVTSITPAQSSNAVPDTLRKLMPVGDGNISGNTWYLFADPAILPCFLYGYLEGFLGPRLSTDQPFNVQGLSVKLEHDFGVSAVDYRGGYKNPGA